MMDLAQLIGASPQVEGLRALITRLVLRGARGARPPAVLIQGETGTGKGLVANLLHRASTRAQAPFVDVNCAALPDSLVESELFGHERGAFTDAHRSKPGLFQTAHGGTLFLDEVGLLPLPLQAKLLTVLEERAVRRLGATQKEPVDVWVISASNADLDSEVRGRRFREDLYHRLAVMTIRVPALRERGEDIVLLAEHFLERARTDYGVPPLSLAPDARERLRTYSWPGNIRELANVMERVALLGRGPRITAASLGLVDPRPAAPAPPAIDAPRRPPALASRAEVLREHLREVLRASGGNISRTAEVLGMSRNTVRARIRKFGLRPDDVDALADHLVASRSTPSDTRPVEPVIVLPVARPIPLTPGVLRGSGAAPPLLTQRRDRPLAQSG